MTEGKIPKGVNTKPNAKSVRQPIEITGGHHTKDIQKKKD